MAGNNPVTSFEGAVEPGPVANQARPICLAHTLSLYGRPIRSLTG